MLEHLKIKIKSLEAEARIIEGHERHYLQNARTLSGVYDRKHQKDDERPHLKIKGCKYPDDEEARNRLKDKQERAFNLDDADVLARRDYDAFWGLTHHRVNVVRKEARDSLVAYAFLKGRSYSEVEGVRYTHPRWANVERIILSFGLDEARANGVSEQVLRQRFAEWTDEAKRVLPKNWNLPQ